MKRILIVLVGLLGFGLFVLIMALSSYCCFYKLSLKRWLNKPNLAEKKIDHLTIKKHVSDREEVMHVLLFLGDTLNIIRKDTVKQHIVDSAFANCVGRQGNGVLTYSGAVWYGREDFKIKIENQPLVISIISEPNPDAPACALNIHF